MWQTVSYTSFRKFASYPNVYVVWSTNAKGMTIIVFIDTYDLIDDTSSLEMCNIILILVTIKRDLLLVA